MPRPEVPESFVELFNDVERKINTVIDGARPVDVAAEVIVAITHAIDVRLTAADEEVLKLKRALATTEFDFDVLSMRDAVRTEMIRLSADLYDQTCEQQRTIERRDKIISNLQQQRRDAENVLLAFMTMRGVPELTVTFEAIRRALTTSGIDITRNDETMTLKAEITK